MAEVAAVLWNPAGEDKKMRMILYGLAVVPSKLSVCTSVVHGVFTFKTTQIWEQTTENIEVLTLKH